MCEGFFLNCWEISLTKLTRFTDEDGNLSLSVVVIQKNNKEIDISDFWNNLCNTFDLWFVVTNQLVNTNSWSSAGNASSAYLRKSLKRNLLSVMKLIMMINYYSRWRVKACCGFYESRPDHRVCPTLTHGKYLPLLTPTRSSTVITSFTNILKHSEHILFQRTHFPTVKGLLYVSSIIS